MSYQKSLAWFCAMAVCCGGCAAPSGPTGRAGNATQIAPGSGAAAGTDGFAGTSGAALASGQAGAAGAAPQPGVVSCNAGSTNQEGCTCGTLGATAACYPGSSATRGVGACHDGTQTCLKTGNSEFDLHYGPCTAYVVPSSCAMDVDARCSGKVGCDDPQCASVLPCAQDAGTPAADGGGTAGCDPAKCPMQTGVLGPRKPCCIPDGIGCGGIGLTGECEAS